MKTAKTTILPVFEVNCPYCFEPIGNPNNSSYIWTTDDYDGANAFAKCESPACGKTSRLPNEMIRASNKAA